jgi:ubiquinone/menaquinone biosynthesis C-methylase UbiE
MAVDYNRRRVDYNHIHATPKEHYDILFELMKIMDHQSVMDIGGGYGEILLEFKKRYAPIKFFYDLLEPSRLQILKGRERISHEFGKEHTNRYVRFIETDFLSLIPEKNYDHVILKMVFHEFNLDDKVSALKKAKSLCKEDGKLTIWRPYLPQHIRDFFSAIMLKKDELAGYQLLRESCFESENQFKEILVQADLPVLEPVFIFEYIFDSFRRFESEFSGNQEIYQKWLDFIEEIYDAGDKDLKNQVKLVRGSNGIYLNFQRGIYQFQ